MVQLGNFEGEIEWSSRGPFRQQLLSVQLWSAQVSFLSPIYYLFMVYNSFYNLRILGETINKAYQTQTTVTRSGQIVKRSLS